MHFKCHPLFLGGYKRSISAMGLGIAICGGLFLCTPTVVLSQCMPAQPASVLLSSGNCTDTGGERKSQIAGTPAIDVTAGEYTAEGVTVNNGFSSTPAVRVDGTGIINLTDGTTVTTTESHGYGIQVKGDGTVNATNTQITTQGYGADAILAEGNGATVTLRDVEILTSGTSARGMRVRDGALAEGYNISIRTTEDDGNDAGSYGVWVEDGSEVTLVDSSVSTETSDSSAVENWGGTFVGKGVSLSAKGSGAYSSGVFVYGERH